jgi:hypothetical protein
MKSKGLDNICFMGFFLAIIFILSGYKKTFVEGFDNPIDYPISSKNIEQSCNMAAKPSGSCKKRVGFWCSLA